MNSNRNNIGEKPEAMKAELAVKEKTYLTPNYIRVILEGDMQVFSDARVGDNNKIVIPHRSLPTSLSVDALKPIIRTYTMRAIDYEQNLMAIDFVAHGEGAPASAWAACAQEGDKLVVMMKPKSKPLFVPSDHYFLAGDHTALPVISVILEQLPADAVGEAVIEVYGQEDVLNLKKPEGMNLSWLFNNTPGRNSNLLNSMKNNTIFDRKDTFVFAAAEQDTVKEIQQFLREETPLERKQWQALSYWKFGVSEDVSAAERRSLSH
ncbi:siderophore-interacting protein [Chryseobacterium gambrini]|uniref:siderophore-interacting protein n=1 Tax=Chryseobacterium gambrini TaxID=373672 RepID=UPI0022F3D16A|nr:siderophore-interacting protein [Chryseobacterium gambrini]WBX97625.1 siderophore-interacting protein [Chryseobacterium gambrini]